MPQRRSFAILLLVLALILYALILGGTFNGVISLQITGVTLTMLTAGVASWLAVRWRYHWKWLRTPLNPVLMGAVIAVAIAVFPNLESARRMALGLWFWGLYLGVWILLNDLAANGLPVRWLGDGLLLTGVPVLLFGAVQVRPWLAEWLRIAAAGLPVPFVPPRPSSIIGNPNALGCTLIVMCLLALGRLVLADRRWQRIGWGLYIAASLGLLFLTLSRGAMFGLLAGGGVWLILWKGRALGTAVQRGIQQIRHTKALALILLVATVAAALILLPAFWNVLNDQPGRDFSSTRAIIWDAAVEDFLTHPLTGSGPFTFGKALLQHQSTPPLTAHSHAHSLPLNVAAEMGLPGLAALIALAVAIGFCWVRRWQSELSAGRIWLAAVAAALVAYSAHHLLDMPMMMPSIALMGIMLIVMATVGNREVTSQTVGIDRWRSIAAVGLWALLIVTGWWSYSVKGQYMDALLQANAGDWRGGGEALREVSAADAAMPLYPGVQGYLYGTAAAQGDAAAVQDGIAALEAALALEDVYAPWWANLAVLRQQAGDVSGAIRDMAEAVRRAPQGSMLWLNLGLLYEAEGNAVAAQEAFSQALALNPAIGWASFWTETETRQQALNQFGPEGERPEGFVLAALAAIQHETPQDAIEEINENGAPSGAQAVERVLLALAHEQLGQPDQADLWLDSARLYPLTQADVLWIAVGQAVISMWRGDPEAPERIQAASELFTTGKRGTPFYTGENYAWFHFLRGTFSEQYVPQFMTLADAPLAGLVLDRLVLP